MAQNPKCFKTALWGFCAFLGIRNQGIFNFLSKIKTVVWKEKTKQ